FADDLPDSVDACKQQVIDKRDRAPIALFGYYDNRRVAGLLNRQNAGLVVAGVRGRALSQRKQLGDWYVVARASEGPEHSRVRMDSLAQLRAIALRLAFRAQLRHAADRIVIIHHAGHADAIFGRLGHLNSPLR